MLYDRVSEVAANNPSKTAIVFEGRKVTYADLLSAIDNCADHLASRGIGAGNRVLAFLDNSPEFIMLQVAVARVGGIFVPVDYRLGSRDIQYILNDMSPDLVVTDAEAMGRLGNTVDAAIVGDLQGFGVPAPRKCRELQQVSPEKDYFIIYSSGSTGFPKGIVHSQQSLARIVDSWIATIGLLADDELLCTLVFSHGHSQMILVWPALFCGATLHLLNVNKLTPSRVLRYIRDNHVTIFSNLPVFYELALRVPDGQFDITRLRNCFCGSAPLREELGRHFHRKYDVHLRNLYGITEVGPSHVNMDIQGAGAYSSVGQCLKGMSCETVDDDRRPLAPGQIGEIRFRSLTFFNGYHNQSSATRDMMPGDGWVYSRDLGYLDRDGNLYVTGRKSDFVNVSGNKVSPDEVEDVLKGHEGIRDVGVFGEESELHGERVVAVYVADHPIDDQSLQDFCLKNLAPFKIPTRFVYAERLPRTSFGKLQKQKLKHEYGQAMSPGGTSEISS